MIYHPISQYLEHTDLMTDSIKTIMGERFFGIETNLDGQFMLLANDVTQAEKDALDALEYPVKKILKINRFTRVAYDPCDVPIDTDFVSGLKIKLHRKSIIIKGEIKAEEFYEFCDNNVFSNLIVKEATTFTRNVLGFPLYKDVVVTWYNEDGTPNIHTKTWRSYYSQLEQIKEGKSRRGNLVSNLQMPCIGLISIAMTGTPNPSPAFIVLTISDWISSPNTERAFPTEIACRMHLD